MFLLNCFFKNARENGTGELRLRKNDTEIDSWTFLPAGAAGRELLQLIAIVCGGIRVAPRLPFSLPELSRDPDRSLQIEFILALHQPYEVSPQGEALRGSGILIDGKGQVRGLSRTEYRVLPSTVTIRGAKTGLGHSSYFILGYGCEPKPHDGTDDFDFSDPYFRVTRFHSLFSNHSLLTDPVAFLARTHYRGIGCKRHAPLHVLERLARLLKKQLAMDTDSWLEKECDFDLSWRTFEPWQRSAALPALDAARHRYYGFQTNSTPLDLPGLLLFDRPDCLSDAGLFPRWVGLMAELLPNSQFVVTASESARRDALPLVAASSQQIPNVPKKPTKTPSCAPRGSILLVDGDSTLPNLALMKLSRYFKEQGRTVILARREASITGVEAIHASFVFNRPVAQSRIHKLRKYYGKALFVGGSGVDVELRLPEEIESLPADYGLYPELGGDTALGFITRGCPYHCPFCIVPQKEGATRQVATLEELLPDGERKLILLDDNLLSHPNAGEILEEMAVRDLEVNFTQTLDLRFLDQEKVRLLKRIRCSNLKFTRRVYHFSLNDSRNLDEVAELYKLFDFIGKDNVEFICMYGFTTTLAEDVTRLRFLRSLPGAYVFMQEYQPILGGPPAKPNIFFNDRADELIDELLRINFTQNMKNMEVYYRWVSKRYAQTFGKLHDRLVDTIFRYNNRQGRGLYIATMARLGVV